jgi:hypothetical protein
LRRKGQRTKFARIMASERTIRPYAWLSVSASLLLIVAASTHAWAQTDQLGEEERLEREFTNPLTTLPQLLVRDSYSPATYGRCNLLACPRNAETNQIIIRPLFPRIPSNTLLPFIQLVRPTFSVLTVPSSRGGVRTEFGDLPLFDIAVLPWPDRQKTGVLVGVGLSLVFPTATSKSAGQGAWQAGPALGVLYQGIPGLLVGFVAQNPISFAYTSPRRIPQNTLIVQPVLALHLWRKWYLRSAEGDCSAINLNVMEQVNTAAGSPTIPDGSLTVNYERFVRSLRCEERRSEHRGCLATPLTEAPRAGCVARPLRSSKALTAQRPAGNWCGRCFSRPCLRVAGPI